MSGLQLLVVLEMAVFFGAILAFSWWQVRLMRREVDDSKGSALASPPRSQIAADGEAAPEAR